jgi:hypothetical protein
VEEKWPEGSLGLAESRSDVTYLVDHKADTWDAGMTKGARNRGECV